jgi:hypothetical protein
MKRAVYVAHCRARFYTLMSGVIIWSRERSVTNAAAIRRHMICSCAFCETTILRRCMRSWVRPRHVAEKRRLA